MKIGIIGDLHLRENLGYSDYISDRRIPEKKEILDFMVESLKDCKTIIFMGDQFNQKNNPSEVIREFVEFLERLGKKEIYMLAGNHGKHASGRSAIDFLREVNKPNWHIFTDRIELKPVGEQRWVFCPFMTKPELGVKDDDAWQKVLLEKIPITGDILYIHHAISDSVTTAGCSTNVFDEVVLPKKELEKRFKLVVGGHVHSPQVNGRTVVAGSIFNNEVGDKGKFIWKIDESTLKIEKIALPGREIHKIENPTEKELSSLKKNSIVKVILTEKKKIAEVEELREKLKKNFDAYLLLEQYPHERRKIDFEGGAMDFNVDNLLTIYAKEKKINLVKLKAGYQLVK